MIPKHASFLSSVILISGLCVGCAQRGDFTLTSADGEQVSLSDYRGNAVLLSFGAVG